VSYYPCFPDIQSAVEHLTAISSHNLLVDDEATLLEATVKLLGAGEGNEMQCRSEKNRNIGEDLSSSNIEITIQGDEDGSVLIDCENEGRAFDLRTSGIVNIRDLTITNCTPRSGPDVGGAILGSLYTDKTLEFDNIIFLQNYAYQNGGAIALTDACIDCSTDLSSHHGTNDETKSSSYTGPMVMFSNCTFEENSAEYGGGAIFLENTNGSNIPHRSRAQFENCRFDSNNAIAGGALLLSSPDVSSFSDSYESCVFSSNVAQDRGGAIDYFGPSSSISTSDLSKHGSDQSTSIAVTTFSSCVFRGNLALGGTTTSSDSEMQISVRGGAGGAVHSVSVAMQFDSCVFDSNEASDSDDPQSEYDDDESSMPTLLTGARGGAISVSSQSALAMATTSRLLKDAYANTSPPPIAVRIHNSTFTSNVARSYGTASSTSYVRSSSGGAVWIELGICPHSPTTLTQISESTFSSNSAETSRFGAKNGGSSAGGAVFLRHHPVTYCPLLPSDDDIKESTAQKFSVESCSFFDNYVGHAGRGGALCAEGHGMALNVSKSNFQSNLASSSMDDMGAGGAVALLGGSRASVTGSMFNNNKASPKVPVASSNFPTGGRSGKGGAIYVSEATIFAKNCHIAHNSCESANGDAGDCEGGGIYIGTSLDHNGKKRESEFHATIFEFNSALAAHEHNGHGISQSTNSGRGGAAFVYRAQPIFDKCAFNSNRAVSGMGGTTASGGAVELSFSNDLEEDEIVSSSVGTRFVACNFTRNAVGDDALSSLHTTPQSVGKGSITSQTGRGGAVSAVASKVSFRNSTLYKNMAFASADASLPSFAGGIFLDELSSCVIEDSKLEDNHVINGMGTDLVSIEALPGGNDIEQTKEQGNRSSKLIFERSTLRTNIQDNFSDASSRDIFVLMTAVPSILLLGDTINFGVGNNFGPGSSILIAGTGSKVGRSILGVDVQLREANLNLDVRSPTENLSVVAWNASVTFASHMEGTKPEVPRLSNLGLIGSSVMTSDGIVIEGDAGFIEGTITSRPITGRGLFEVRGDLQAGYVEEPAHRRDWYPDRLISWVELDRTVLMVSGKFVANGSELRLKGNSTVLVPKNGYFDMMADTNIQVEPSDATHSFALINEGFIRYRTCDMHTLEIKGGGFMQTENGNVEVTLSTKQQNSPFKLHENIDFSGTIHVKFCENTVLSDSSSWTIASSRLDPAYMAQNDINTNRFQLNVSMPEGITAQLVSEAASASLSHVVNETLRVSPGGIACESVLEYSTLGSLGESCTTCLSSSSECTWLQSTCVTPSSPSERDLRSCCPDSCNNRGTCNLSSGECYCGWFFVGDSCSSISDAGLYVVIGVVSAALILIMTLVYNKYNRRSRKLAVTTTLEELRRELLESDELLSVTSEDVNDYNDSSPHRNSVSPDRQRRLVSPEYIQDIQKQLFMKDVSVQPQDVQIGRKIGDGAFGDVYVGNYRETTVAIKMIRQIVLLDMSDEEVESFKREAYIMSRLRHPNIALFMGIVSVASNDTDSSGFESLYILSEYMDKGSLTDILEKVNLQEVQQMADSPEWIDWSYERIITCAIQAGLGMSYLHNHVPPICHRDLKSSNLLVDSRWVVKVADFGVSRIMRDDGNVGGDVDLMEQHQDNLLKTTLVGTVAWAAPEMLVHEAKTNYTLKVDQYSFGVVLWELWERARPFSQYKSRFAIMDAVRDGERPRISRPGCPDGYKRLIGMCLQEDPSARPTFSYIVKKLKDELRDIDQPDNGSNVSIGFGSAEILT